MPYNINNIIYVSYTELIDSSISTKYMIKDALRRQRQGKVNCWQHKRFDLVNGKWVEYTDKSRKGKVYIVYDTLKDNYKIQIKKELCGDTDPYVWVKNKETEEKEKKLDNICQSLVEKLKVNPKYISEFIDTGNYSNIEAQQLTRSVAWLELLNSIKIKEAHKMGFESIQHLREKALDTINKELDEGLVKFKANKLNSVQVLFKYMAKYKKQGINCLISGKFGNQNTRKINDEQHAWLMAEMSKPTKQLFEDIAQKYNTEAVEKYNWPNLTTAAIKHHLNKKENVRIWHFSRHGVDASNNEFQSLIKRNRPSFPDALISIDGTALQLYYKDSSGKMRSDLYYYLVTDAYSLSIVGYAVAYTETSELVMEALKNYVDTFGYKPYQLQYDNSSANVSGAIQGLMNNMSKVAFPCKPYSGRSKIVETIIGNFEQSVLRQYENFKGGSPTTKNLNSKANPELIKKIQKDLPTEEQVIEMFKDAVNEWNLRGERRNGYGQFEGETRLEKYAHQHDKRVRLNYFEKMMLFMVELPKQYKYTNKGITIKGIDYIVPDPDEIGDFIFQNLHYGELFTVRVNLSMPGFIHLFKNNRFVAEAFEKESYASCVADMKEGEASKIRIYQLKQKQYGEIQSRNELERQRQFLESRGIATGTYGHSWQDIPKADYNRKESQEVDIINGVSQESELVRRLKRIGN